MKKFFHALGWAWQGICQAFQEERNLKIHCVAAVLVVLAGLALQISLTHWMILVFAIGLVFICEMMNTAIERMVDLATAEYHPLAAAAKNMAAGAVLIAAITSVVIGILVFLPYLLEKLGC